MKSSASEPGLKIIIKYLKINSTLPKRVPGFLFLSRQVGLLGVKRQKKYKIKDFFYSDDTFLKPYHFQIYSIFFLRLVQIDLRSGVLHAFLFRRQKKKFPFYNQSFFVISPEDPVHSSIFHGITCGLGIICGRGSLAVLYRPRSNSVKGFAINHAAENSFCW